MKLLSLSALIAILFLSSCSKKADVTPTTTGSILITGTVTIAGINYPTIVIGSQTWTSSNYVGTAGINVSSDPTFGNYYTLTQAQTITLPAGWRIPTRADYNTMLGNFTATVNSSGDKVGGIAVAEALADSVKWHGATNSSGFGAFPGGYYDPTLKTLINQFADGVYLTSTTAVVNSATVNYVFGINDDGVSVGQSNLPYYASLDYFSNPFSYSLRFVKDN